MKSLHLYIESYYIHIHTHTLRDVFTLYKLVHIHTHTHTYLSIHTWILIHTGRGTRPPFTIFSRTHYRNRLFNSYLINNYKVQLTLSIAEASFHELKRRFCNGKSWREMTVTREIVSESPEPVYRDVIIVNLKPSK